MSRRFNLVCCQCGGHAQKASYRGSLGVEILLWFFCTLIIGFIIAPIYSIYRRCGKSVCPSCGAVDLVPAESPRARQLDREFAALMPTPILAVDNLLDNRRPQE